MPNEDERARRERACRFTSTCRKKNATDLAVRVASEQWGVISARQLRDCGVTQTTAHRWRAAGRLHVVHRGVYALGHESLPIEGRLVAGLLMAGPAAVLSHATAAWWWGLVADQPSRIEVSTTSRAGSAPGVVVHRRRRLESTRKGRFPVTTIPCTLLDFASRAPLHRVRKALAEADYRGLLDVEAVERALGPGRPGSGRLRLALIEHQPRLAWTDSELEDAFIALCESGGIPLPEVNVWIAGWRVDAIWRSERLVVELDGYRNHHSRAQLKRDRRKELCLRGAGLTVVRYSEEQVRTQREAVLADVRARRAERATVNPAAPSGGSGSR